MSDTKKIKSALISVYYKENLDKVVELLNKNGVKIYSTGGTQKFIEDQGLQVTPVEDLTSYPSILGGRVKTLHPKVFGGILSRRNNDSDKNQLKEYDIPEIDLVIVDLYPFEETVKSGASEQDIIEKIDIGGIALIRAAAKNYKDILIVPSRNQYESLIDLLEKKNGNTDIEDRKAFAIEAFNTSSHYDSAIFNHLNNDGSLNKISLKDGKSLRYGENPHQAASFFKFNNSSSSVTISNAKVLQGKELSYNNMLDADAAWKSASDAYYATESLGNRSAVSVIKHLNPCGLAVSDNTLKSLELAWAGDPVSAFGSIICFTDTVNEDIANWFSGKFIEIIIAPEYTDKALKVFSKKKNLRLLVSNIKPVNSREKIYRSINGGMLVQDEDELIEKEFEKVTKTEFTDKQVKLAKFGTQTCKHLKSNAIALVTENSDGSFWLTGAGMGQPNRLDSLRWLTVPRFNQKEDIKIEDAVLISDAFFPFADSIEEAEKAGVKNIVQPGGSIRDDEVIKACDEKGIAMVFTGKRHFRH